MKKITQNKKLELAQKFFEIIWNQIEEGDDYIYEELDPECDYGDALCEEFNNDTILEVLRIGFREKFGQDLKCGKLTSEIEREDKEETPQVEKVKKPLAHVVGDMVVDAIYDGISNYLCSNHSKNFAELNDIIKYIKAEWVAKKLQMEKTK